MTRAYRPSNSTEGDCFDARWCARCWRDAAHRAEPDAEDGCEIIANAMAYDIGDANYPREWIEDAQGPRCTAFAEDRIEHEGPIWDARQMDMLA
jgi:hypothetical protein